MPAPWPPAGGWAGGRAVPARPREHHCLAPGPPRCAQGGAHARAAPALPLHHLGPPYGGWGRPFRSNPTDSGDLRPEDLASNSLPGRFRPGNFVGPTGGYLPSFLRSFTVEIGQEVIRVQSPRDMNSLVGSVTLLPRGPQAATAGPRRRARRVDGGKGVAGSGPQHQRAFRAVSRAASGDIPATNQNAVLSFPARLGAGPGNARGSRPSRAPREAPG